MRKEEEDVPVITEEMMRKTQERMRKHKKTPKITKPFTCPVCKTGMAEYTSNLCFDTVLGGEHIIIPNLTGHKCSTCKEEFYDAQSSGIIDKSTAEKISTGHEATVTVAGGRRLGIYFPKDILRAMKIKAKEKVLITPISKKKMVVEIGA